MNYEEFEEILLQYADDCVNLYPRLWAKNRSKRLLNHFSFRCVGNRKRRKLKLNYYTYKIQS